MARVETDATGVVVAGPGISFAQVGLAYDGDGGSMRALRDLTFSIEPGEPVSIIGPSGCGKSSLLHMLAGLVEPTEGLVSVDGKPIAGSRQGTAFIPQNLGLFPWKTVLQNASLGMDIRGMGRVQARERALDALCEVGLDGFASAYPKELSGGMKQRLALARAIAMDMDLLLMDEPLSAVDALLRESLQDILLELWKRRGQTQILVTHSIEEAVYLGRRILVFSDRPGTLAGAVRNPGMGRDGYRDSAEFAACCRRVREVLAAGWSVSGEAVA